MPRPKGSRNKKLDIKEQKPDLETTSTAETAIIGEVTTTPTPNYEDSVITEIIPLDQPKVERGWCKKCQCGHDLVDGKCTR